MIQSADEFQIVQNVIENTRGIKNTVNWYKVQIVLLGGTTHAGRTSSIEKTIEMGVNPDSCIWEKVKKC